MRVVYLLDVKQCFGGDGPGRSAATSNWLRAVLPLGHQAGRVLLCKVTLASLRSLVLLAGQLVTSGEKAPPESYNDWPNLQGFSTSYEERTPVELVVTGEIPPWAAGTLYRTGIGQGEIKTEKNGTFKTRHWFDALAVVHRFQILPPNKDHPNVRVIYNSRSTCDGLIAQIQKTGDPRMMSFGRRYDPCRSLFQKVMSVFTAMRDPAPDEVSMSVTLSAGFPGLEKIEKNQSSGKIRNLVNKTDTSRLQSLDPETLEPVGLASQTILHPDLKGPMSAAHARSDPVTGDVFNYNLELGRKGTYRVFRVSASTGRTSILATIRADAAYLHSFCLTEHYVILCVWNSFHTAGGLKTLWNGNIADGLAYDSSRPARWYVIDRRSPQEGGQGLVAVYESDAFFCFHTANAFEEPSSSVEGKDIIVDLVIYNNLDCLKQFYFENLISASPSAAASAANSTYTTRLTRFRLPSVPVPDSNQKQMPKKTVIEFQANLDEILELPTVNPRYVTRPHRYIYGVKHTGNSTFFDGLIKYDTVTRKPTYWNRHSQSAGEPIFIPRRSTGNTSGNAPEEFDEDDGVLLSVVLDGTTGKSYLLVLDAKTMTEVARAGMNGAVGFGFHGTHVSDFEDGRGLDI
ncbi:oxidoreductase [Emydomyces testavorans]|uniref:Oxidoreductase n=1 Tax=Emydomyces testavorans TaxID=2070801 RepID=A0AAF0D9X9_9EURO|nr:oxidoreductase [Emydomyces testavorans]